MSCDGEMIATNFKFFSNGIRVVFLINRDKMTPNKDRARFQKKIITTNLDEFCSAIKYLIPLAVNNNERIYVSCNERDQRKAERHFKKKMLEKDYEGEQQRFQFYKNIKNEWISSLCKPSSRKTKYFLIDCDTLYEENINLTRSRLMNSGIKIVQEYKTPGGAHFIIEPCNPLKLSDFEYCTLHKDGLVLLYSWLNYKHK